MATEEAPRFGSGEKTLLVGAAVVTAVIFLGRPLFDAAVTLDDPQEQDSAPTPSSSTSEAPQATETSLPPTTLDPSLPVCEATGTWGPWGEPAQDQHSLHIIQLLDLIDTPGTIEQKLATLQHGPVDCGEAVTFSDITGDRIVVQGLPGGLGGNCVGLSSDLTGGSVQAACENPLPEAP